MTLFSTGHDWERGHLGRIIAVRMTAFKNVIVVLSEVLKVSANYIKLIDFAVLRTD